MANGSLRQQLGCWRHERWQAELSLRWPSLAARCGITLNDHCNRNEQLQRAEGSARVCLWQDSSWLTLGRVFPKVTARLLRTLCPESEIALCAAETTSKALRSSAPELTVILPVGGQDRLPQTLACLAALRGQQDIAMEIIAVEHAVTADYQAHLPNDVNYIFISKAPDEGFNKSLAMNSAAAASTAENLLFLDADLIVQRSFCRQIVQRLRHWQAYRPVRYAFHLDEQASASWLRRSFTADPIEAAAWSDHVADVQQNNPGLCTAVQRRVYWQIGGHDETFVGWGGEDLEFLDRLRLVKLLPGADCSVVHLWHSSAPQKASGHRNNHLQRQNRAITPEVRIQRLRSQNQHYCDADRCEKLAQPIVSCRP